MRIAILGGGAGAHAMAADLSLAGHEIRIAELPRFAENLAAVQALGGIQLLNAAPMGGKPGFTRVHLATTSVREAVQGAELLMLVVPAYGHEVFMREIVQWAEPGQVVVIHSGYFGALVLGRLLAEAGRSDDLIIGETTSLIYLAQLRGAGRVWIKAGKKQMPFAALPARKTEEALRRINAVYPQFVPARNVFETSTNEAGIPVHTVTTLLNLSRIEQIGPYRSNFYDMTPGVGRVMDAVDGEKQAVQSALGLNPLSLPGMLNQMWGIDATNCYEAMRSVPSYSYQTTPDSLQHRYITEDVPYGLVPIAVLGDLAGVETPTIKSLVQLFAAASGEDYWKSGRTARQMGLSGMNRDELLRCVS